MQSDLKLTLTEDELIQNRITKSDKPIIGLLFDWRENLENKIGLSYVYYNEKSIKYINCVKKAGGEPFIISFSDQPEKVIPFLDGLIICGGRDIHPKFYGEEVNGTKIPPNNLRFEYTQNFYKAVPLGLPIFGICWGMQFLNVVHGGSLIQDIEDKELHAEKDRTVSYIEDSVMFKLTGGKSVSKCMHHQAIKVLADGFKITGWDDVSKIPHAFELISQERWIVAVQFHPEMEISKDFDENSIQSNLKMIKGFVEKSAEFMAKRAN